MVSGKFRNSLTRKDENNWPEGELKYLRRMFEIVFGLVWKNYLTLAEITADI